MRPSSLVVLIICAAASAAGATPTDEEQLPIDIPASAPGSTRLALALKDACDTVAAHRQRLLEPKASRGFTFDAAPFAAWSGPIPAEDDLAKERAAAAPPRRRRELEATAIRLKQMNEAASALRDACDAIAGSQPFTAQSLESIRAFARAPDTASSQLKAFLLRSAVTEQGSLGGVSALTSGSLEAYLIQGLATFVYNRAKAEALNYLAARLKGLLCSTERKPFFKNVCVAFEDLDGSVALSAIGSYLAAAARKDVARLPDMTLVYALSSLTAQQGGATSCGAHAAACEALTDARIALAFYQEVAHGRRALDVARALHAISFTARQGAQAPRSIAAITLASQLLDAIMRQEGWHLTAESRDELPYFAISTLLTLEELRASWSLKADWLNAKAGWLLKLGALIRRVAEVHARIEAVIKTLQRPPEPDEGAGAGAGAGAAPAAVKLSLALSRSDLARAASSALLILLDLPIADLGVAVPDGVLRIRKLTHLGELLASGDAPASVTLELQDLLVRVAGDPALAGAPAIAKVRSALPLIAQLARAESADEVTKILEAAAAPVGGHRRKTEKALISLTAFAGASIAQERIAGQSWGTPIGVFAPIGIHATWPVKRGEWGEWGVMLSLLNLGNLVSERLDGDLETTNGSTTSKVASGQSESLRSVFSPGVLVTKSVAGPFNVGVGAQVVPSAREVTTTVTVDDVATTEVERRAALQLVFFFGVDVTIFPF